MVVVLDTLAKKPRHPEKAHRPDMPSGRKPDWIRVRAPGPGAFAETTKIVREHGLNTVCVEASCPNIGECWAVRHATFMILGDTCTRACAFCNVKTGLPEALDPHEPVHVAEATARLGLKHVVVTSVDRDDLDDGGADHFVQTIRAIREKSPGTTVEVLTPDFLRKAGALEPVVAAQPDVLNHNLDTVPSRAALAAREGDRSVELHQSRDHGGLGRDAKRNFPGDGRFAQRGRRFHHHRPVSAADTEASSGDPLR